MKNRTKALAITSAVKKAVAKRDSFEDWPCCLLCGAPAPTSNPHAFSCAHYISRAQGGLGREENILTLCPGCHRRYDQEEERVKLRPYFRRYLMERYPNWNEKILLYKKE